MFQAVNTEDLPKANRQRGSSKYTPEQIAQAVEVLQNGQAIVLEGEFKNEGAARRAGLLLRGAINDSSPEFEDGVEPSTQVYTEDGEHRVAIVLRAPKAKKDA